KARRPTMKDRLFDPLPGDGQYDYLFLWLALNAVVALAIGFVLGWALRPAAPAVREPQRPVVRRLPTPPGVAVLEEDEPFAPRRAPGAGGKAGAVEPFPPGVAEPGRH